MKNDKTYKWKVFLLFFVQAARITVSAACSNFGGDTRVDITKRPSDPLAVFSFTRVKNLTHQSEVSFLEEDFKELLLCLSSHVEGLNSCKLDARFYYTKSDGVLFYDGHNVTDTTTTDGIGSTEETFVRSYECMLPEQFAEDTSPNTIFCKEQQIDLESNCFNVTDLCISLNPKTRNSSYDAVNIMWGKREIITYRYKSAVVSVNPCNSFISTPDNTGIIAGAVCGSLLLIALIIIGILCWKRPVVIWKRGRKLSTDPAPTGISTSNVSQLSADNVIYNDEEIYPSSQSNQQTMSSTLTSDYASIDSENLDKLEEPTRHKENIKDIYASVHKSRKRVKKQKGPENSTNSTAQNPDTSEKIEGKRKSITDVYASIHKSRKRAKNHQQRKISNENADQTPQMEHYKTDVTNDVQKGDKKKLTKYSRLHEANVSSVNPYDDLLEPNNYHDAASAEAINDLSNEESDCHVVDKPIEEASNHIREAVGNQATTEKDSKLKTKPVIPSKPQLLTKQGNKQDEISNGNKVENKDRNYFNVAKGP